jgi:hypothetical protein
LAGNLKAKKKRAEKKKGKVYGTEGDRERNVVLNFAASC